MKKKYTHPVVTKIITNNNNRYLKSVGTKIDTGFATYTRPYTVYIGGVNNANNKDAVANMIGERVKYSNFEQIDTSKHNKFQSFKFNIDYLDKDKIKDKSIWPRGLVVGKYFYKKVAPASSAPSASTSDVNGTAPALSVNANNQSKGNLLPIFLRV